MHIVLSQKICKSYKQEMFEYEDDEYKRLINKIISLLEKDDFKNIKLNIEEKWIVKQSLILKEILKIKEKHPDTFKKFMETEGVNFKLTTMLKNRELRNYIQKIYQ